MTPKPKNQLAQEDQDHIRKMVAQGATDDEFKSFMYLCSAYNLDPLKKEIYLFSDLLK